MTDAPRPIPGRYDALKLHFKSQGEFDAWANGLHGSQHALSGIVMLFVVAATAFAFVVMAPRLVREGGLLWFGEHAEGIVREARIERVGSFKGGDPKYRMMLHYEFATGRGERRIGVTERNDLRYLPDLKPGAPMGIYFARTDPSRSVAEYNLRTDVYALAMFLPFLAVMGVLFPTLYLYRVLRWKLRKA